MYRIIACLITLTIGNSLGSDAPDPNNPDTQFKIYQGLLYDILWESGWMTKAPLVDIPKIERSYQNTHDFDEINHFVLGSYFGFLEFFPQKNPGKITIELSCPSELLASNINISTAPNNSLTLKNQHPVVINGHYATLLPGFTQWKDCPYFFGCQTIGLDMTRIKFMRTLPTITDLTSSTDPTQNSDLLKLMFNPDDYILRIYAPKDIIITVDENLWGKGDTEGINNYLRDRFKNNKDEINSPKTITTKHRIGGFIKGALMYLRGSNSYEPKDDTDCILF